MFNTMYHSRSCGSEESSNSNVLAGQCALPIRVLIAVDLCFISQSDCNQRIKQNIKIILFITVSPSMGNRLLSKMYMHDQYFQKQSKLQSTYHFNFTLGRSIIYFPEKVVISQLNWFASRWKVPTGPYQWNDIKQRNLDLRAVPSVSYLSGRAGVDPRSTYKTTVQTR